MGPGDGRKVAPHLEISDLNLHSLVLLKALDGAGGGGGGVVEGRGLSSSLGSGGGDLWMRPLDAPDHLQDAQPPGLGTSPEFLRGRHADPANLYLLLL